MTLTIELSWFSTGCKSKTRRPFCMMLTMKLFGVSTGCKSESRRPFLHDADNGIVWVFNRM